MISCHRGDLPLLKGCLASVAENLPDLPICLVAHGDFNIAEFQRVYGVQVLRESDVDPRLRSYSYGYGLTKMVSFWHSPFERFLHVDPDAVLWGNPISDAPWADYDVIYNEPHEVITASLQREQYFDPGKVELDFDWRTCPFFNTGIFLGRRGCLDLDEYLYWLRVQRERPGALFTDQGPLNILVFGGVARGELMAREWPLQAVVPVIPTKELEDRFVFDRGRPVVSPDDRRLIHWAGPKPFLIRRPRYSTPMTHYRLQHMRNVRSPLAAIGPLALRAEEVHTRFTAHHGGSYVRAARSNLTWLASRLRPGWTSAMSQKRTSHAAAKARARSRTSSGDDPGR
jgi:hypothetical protein